MALVADHRRRHDDAVQHADQEQVRPHLQFAGYVLCGSFQGRSRSQRRHRSMTAASSPDW